MKNILPYIANGLQYVAIATQLNETFALVQLILSICTSLIIFAFTIWKWWKKATEDGEITADEIDEAIDIVKDAKSNLGDKK